MKKDSLLFLIATIIFGTNGLISRYIEGSRFFLVACRGLISSVFIFIVLKISGNKINWLTIKKNLKELLASGIVLGFMWLFLYTGYTYSVSVTSLVNNTAPVFLIIICAFLYKEKLNFKQILCVIAVFIGVLMVSGVFDEKLVVDIRSIIFGFLSCICFCINVLVNKRIEGIDAFDRTLVQLFISSIVSSVATLITSQVPTSLDSLSIVLIIVLGILNTGVAYLLYYKSIITMPAYEIAIIGYLEPVISIITGVVFLHEQITILGVLGSAIIIIATCISEFVGNK